MNFIHRTTVHGRTACMGLGLSQSRYTLKGLVLAKLCKCLVKSLRMNVYDVQKWSLYNHTLNILVLNKFKNVHFGVKPA